MDERTWNKAQEFDISPDMTTDALRQAAANYAKVHSGWYTRHALYMGAAWNYLTLATIMLSAISSIVVAYDLGPEWRFIPAVLSALAAFFAALLSQFRVRDLWQIRELGRIDAERLVAKAYLIDGQEPGTSGPQSGPGNAALRQVVALRQELHDLELDQAHQFFAVPKKGTA